MTATSTRPPSAAARAKAFRKDPTPPGGRPTSAILTGTRYEEVGNTPFTSEELAEIAEQLRQIKEYVSTAYALSEAQMLHLEAKLDDIAAAAGTVMHKTRLELRTWFWAAYLVSTFHPGISAKQLQRQLGLGCHDEVFRRGGD